MLVPDLRNSRPTGEKPTRDSIQDYRFVRVWVGGVYALLIICLVSFGCYETYSTLT